MMQKNTKRNKQKHLKTQTFQQLQSSPLQFGKPVVRLPVINKKSGGLKFRYDNTIDRSLDSKDKNLHNKTILQKQDFSINAEESILRKYSNNSQLQLLTFEELQLCADRSKKILPKIAQLGVPSRQNTQRSINEEFHRRLNRIKSEKKIDSNSSELCSYKLGPVLGRGNYSIVKLCQTNQGKKFAAKVYPKQKINSPQRELNLKQQVNILKQINHPNIIAFKQYIETEQNHYIILELFDNISLIEFIKKQNSQANKEESHSLLSSEPCTTRYKQKPRLTEDWAKIIFKKILEAFAYLHGQGIAHRDIKLENVLVSTQNKDQINIKIIDFGFSCRCTLDKQSQVYLLEMKENKREQSRKGGKVEEEDTFYDYCGTPSYISPQVNNKKGYLARPSDVWALGVLLFFMVTGYFPFKNVTQKTDFNSSIFQQINSSIKLSPSLILLLKKMLRNDPSARPTVKQILTKQDWINFQS